MLDYEGSPARLVCTQLSQLLKDFHLSIRCLFSDNDDYTPYLQSVENCQKSTVTPQVAQIKYQSDDAEAEPLQCVAEMGAVG